MAQEPVPAVRASDADRERVAGILRSAAGKGLLTLDEVDERLAVVYSATHLADLRPLTADLPDEGRRLGAVDLDARARALAGARAHVAAYAGIVTLMVAIWVLTGADYHFWPIWPALGMLPAVVAHVRAARHAGDPAHRWAPQTFGLCGAKSAHHGFGRAPGDRVAA